MRNRNSEPVRVSHPVTGPSLTQQHLADGADINKMVARYNKTGVLGNPNATRRAIFADFSSLDHMEMRNAIADIDQQFASLPAKIRAKFSNNPHQLIRFVEDPANIAEAQKLGLLSMPLEARIPEVEIPVETPPAPKADPESQPGFTKGKP